MHHRVGSSRPHTHSVKHIRRLSACLLFGLSLTGCAAGLAPTPNERPASRATAREHFALFRGHPEAMPDSLKEHLATILRAQGTLNLDPEFVQRGETQNGAAWVFLRNRRMCLVYPRRGSVACSDILDASRKGLSLGTFDSPSRALPRPHDFILIGITPDPVGGVIVGAGRTQWVVGAKTNLYSASSDQPLYIRRVLEKYRPTA